MPTKEDIQSYTAKFDPSVQERITDAYILAKNDKFVKDSLKKEPDFI